MIDELRDFHEKNYAFVASKLRDEVPVNAMPQD